MAKVISKLPEVRRGRPEVYPYKDWFNTKAWELKQGTQAQFEKGEADYAVDAASMKAAIYAAATRKGYLVTIRSTTDSKGVPTLSVQRLVGAVAKNHKRKGRPKKAA